MTYTITHDGPMQADVSLPIYQNKIMAINKAIEFSQMWPTLTFVARELPAFRPIVLATDGSIRDPYPMEVMATGPEPLARPPWLVRILAAVKGAPCSTK